MERKDAERFYREELGWLKVTFTCIHWDGLNDALESKGDPFRLWLSKQVNGSCGTQAMVSRWDKTRDNLYPDCGTEETAAHRMVIQATQEHFCSNRRSTILNVGCGITTWHYLPFQTSRKSSSYSQRNSTRLDGGNSPRVDSQEHSSRSSGST